MSFTSSGKRSYLFFCFTGNVLPLFVTIVVVYRFYRWLDAYLDRSMRGEYMSYNEYSPMLRRGRNLPSHLRVDVCLGQLDMSGRRPVIRKEFKHVVALSIMIEGQNGLTCPRWKQIVREVEDLGFAGLFRSDDFKHAQ